MDSQRWNDRYAEKALVWSADPNALVAAQTAALSPGRALDLASGEGRNAIWLAERGWRVTAVDFSAVASDRARALATQRLGDEVERFAAVTADVLTWQPEGAAYDLVLVVYFHVEREHRRALIRRAAGALAPGGRLLVLGHHRDNIGQGVGGPQDPDLLFTPEDIVDDLDGRDLVIDRAEMVRRPVTAEGTTLSPGSAAPGGSRDALDAFVLARRPA